MSKDKKPRIQRGDLVAGATLVLKKDGSIYTVGEPSHGHQQAGQGGPAVKWSASYFSTYGTRSVSSPYGSYSPTTLASARFHFELPAAQLTAEQVDTLRGLVGKVSEDVIQAGAKLLVSQNYAAGAEQYPRRQPLLLS